MLLLLRLNLEAQGASGEARLKNVFAAEGRMQRRELEAIIKREDEELVLIIAAIMEVL